MSVSKLLMLIGLGLFLVGLALNFIPSLFGWFGRLPGDIRIQDENRFIFFPITSMIIISLVLRIWPKTISRIESWGRGH